MVTATEKFRSGVCIHTNRAIEAMKDGKPGDSIGLMAMSASVGRDCASGANGYGNVQSAIKHVKRVFGVVWAWDRSAAAWKCLNDLEKSESGTSGIKRAGKTLSKAISTLELVATDGFTDDQKAAHGATFIVAKTMKLFSKPEVRKRITTAGVDKFQDDPQKLIELMKRK